ncbi:MAG TPA: hypothetical protein VIL54_07685 [Natronosporangium sp.]|jgi:hypothetical protein
MTDPAGPFADSNFELLALTDHALPATSTSVVTVPISVTVPAGSTLVMEIDAANLNGVGRFLMGANGLGQTAPSYLRSASCGLPNPVDTATIGFPSFHMVMSVTGVAHSTCDAPHDTPVVLDVGEVRLGRAGRVADRRGDLRLDRPDRRATCSGRRCAWSPTTRSTRSPWCG